MVLCKRLIRNEKHYLLNTNFYLQSYLCLSASRVWLQRGKGPFWNTWFAWLFWNKISTTSMLLSFLKNITTQSLNKTIWFGKLLYKSSRKFKTCYENFAIKKYINTCTTLSQNFHSLLKFSMVYNFYDKWLKIRPADILGVEISMELHVVKCLQCT